jgi:hypothetical protein
VQIEWNRFELDLRMLLAIELNLFGKGILKV